MSTEENAIIAKERKKLAESIILSSNFSIECIQGKTFTAVCNSCGIKSYKTAGNILRQKDPSKIVCLNCINLEIDKEINACGFKIIDRKPQYKPSIFKCTVCYNTFKRNVGHFIQGAKTCPICSDNIHIKEIEENNPGFKVKSIYTKSSQERVAILNCSNGHTLERGVIPAKSQKIFCIECRDAKVEEKLVNSNLKVIEWNTNTVKLECKICKFICIRNKNNICNHTTVCENCTIQNKKEKLKLSGFEYISGNLLNYKEHIKVQCKNGHISSKLYDKVIAHKYCAECVKDEKREYLKALGYTAISEDLREGLVVRCSEGHEFNRSFGNFKQNKIKCPICYPYITTEELEIKKFLEDNNYIVSHSRWDLISPYEIDLYIEELNVGIEYNGAYWHSEEIGRCKNIHIDKTTLAYSKGIYLIHIFEKEWKTDKNIKNTLLYILEKIKHKNLDFPDEVLLEVSKWSFLPQELGYKQYKTFEPTIVDDKYTVYSCGSILWKR